MLGKKEGNVLWEPSHRRGFGGPVIYWGLAALGKGEGGTPTAGNARGRDCLPVGVQIRCRHGKTAFLGGDGLPRQDRMSSAGLMCVLTRAHGAAVKIRGQDRPAEQVTLLSPLPLGHGPGPSPLLIGTLVLCDRLMSNFGPTSLRALQETGESSRTQARPHDAHRHPHTPQTRGPKKPFVPQHPSPILKSKSRLGSGSGSSPTPTRTKNMSTSVARYVQNSGGAGERIVSASPWRRASRATGR